MQVVEAQLFDAGPLHGRGPVPVTEVALQQDAAARAREHQPVGISGHESLQVGPELVDQTGGQVHDPPTGGRFGLPDQQLAAVQLDDLLGHDQGAVEQVEVALPQARLLPPPAPGVGSG